MSRSFSDRETATLLAALRYWQREGLMSGGHEQDIATDCGGIFALASDEIDTLCEAINCGRGDLPLEAVGALNPEKEIIFRIVIEEGIVSGVEVPQGSALPQRFPKFVVREYESGGSLDADHITGQDEDGREYYDHSVEISTQHDLMAAIHPLLVTTTLHVTAREARILNEHGYSRNEYGWFVYVGVGNAVVIPEIPRKSRGLAGVIRYARMHKCEYVLFDRDGDALPDIQRYSW